MATRPEIVLPDDHELAVKLSAGNMTIEERMAWVKRTYHRPWEDALRTIENLERQLERAEEAKESMSREVVSYQKRYSDIPAGEQAARQANYEMRGRLDKGRSVGLHAFDRMEEILKEARREFTETMAKPK